jgi:hypothetical protein
MAYTLEAVIALRGFLAKGGAGFASGVVVGLVGRATTTSSRRSVCRATETSQTGCRSHGSRIPT